MLTNSYTLLVHMRWLLCSFQVFDYGAWTFLFMGITELFCRCFYTHALARSGVWERTGKLLGYDLTGVDILAIAALNLVFLYLKVNYILLNTPSVAVFPESRLF